MDEDFGDKEVPTDLLDLFVALDEVGVTPDEFKEALNKDGAAPDDNFNP